MLTGSDHKLWFDMIVDIRLTGQWMLTPVGGHKSILMQFSNNNI